MINKIFLEGGGEGGESGVNNGNRFFACHDPSLSLLRPTTDDTAYPDRESPSPEQQEVPHHL